MARDPARLAVARAAWARHRAPRCPQTYQIEYAYTDRADCGKPQGHEGICGPRPEEAWPRHLEAALAEVDALTERREGVYTASRASVPERGAMWRRLRAEGHCVSATWIDEDGPGQTPDMGVLWRRIVQDETRCRALVLYIEPADLPLKGALVEVGCALAYGARVFVVAPGLAEKDVGSWVRHPAVAWCATIEEAMTMAAGAAVEGA